MNQVIYLRNGSRLVMFKGVSMLELKSFIRLMAEYDMEMSTAALLYYTCHII